MAMTQAERNIALESEKILESFLNDQNKAPVNEEVSGKMVDLKEIENFLNGRELSYLGTNEFKGASGDVSVGVYLMSTKTVEVPKNRNFISLGYEFRLDRDRINIQQDYSTSTSLESFIELPQANHGTDKMSAKDVAKLCDAAQIYNLYQDMSISIMRKLFSHPYHMFTGPNLYKKEEPYDGNTLYVMYDKVRKKFKYSYNPKFILECAIDEWMLQKKLYRSFEDCYTYVLAFMITHEMLHIIHHNTLSTGESGDMVESGDHEVANQVQDSFINCKIARRYIGVEGINKDRRGIAPMPRLGVGSRITVRAEHNNGLKEFANTRELAEAIAEVLKEILKLPTASLNYSGDSQQLNDLAGADVFITVDISPTFSPLRNNGSNTFQRSLDEIIKVITDGKVHGKFTRISDAEKVSDLDRLPDGNLVMFNGTIYICHVTDYDEEKNIYTLNKAQVSGVKKIRQGTSVLCVTEYEQSNIEFGKRHRIQIKPYNPMDDAYTDDERPKQDKLSKEDLQKVKGDQANQVQPQMPQMPGMGGQQNVKNLHVGDIVWVRRLKKFGRITSVDNGKFKLEEVIEKPSKIIDDSDNYYDDGSEK